MREKRREKIGRRAKQGCSLSQLLLHISTEAMMEEALKGVEKGVKVEENILKDVLNICRRQGMIAGNEIGWQIIINCLNVTANMYEKKITLKGLRL